MFLALSKQIHGKRLSILLFFDNIYLSILLFSIILGLSLLRYQDTSDINILFFIVTNKNVIFYKFDRIECCTLQTTLETFIQ